ncbi:hypothetical protein [Streptomyces sp. ODS28]|uniref:hypothetical protein n=1 Tax=Streptomyces sp. ODS28 TaxID=3136688 RepID=UPI0031EFB890
MERRVCGAHIELHPSYEAVLRVIPGNLPEAEPDEMHSALRCTLEAHAQGEHYSLARSLPTSHPAEVWACWADGQQPSGVITLPDCPAINPAHGDEACLLFNEHPGAHSWALTDPEDDALRAHLGLL